MPLRLRAAERAFRFLDVVENGEAALMVGLAIQGRPHRPGGALEQAHAKAPLKALDRLSHGGAGHAAVVGRQGEAAPLHHPHKQTHRIQPVQSASIIRK